MWRARGLTLILGVFLMAQVRAADYVAMSGQDLYRRFCGSCHGTEGRGDGPVAASFGVEVPDLTLLARRAGGQYPRERIVRVIDGRYVVAAHGTRIMPVWGEALDRLELGNPDAQRATETIIARLADYVGQLQRSPIDNTERTTP